MATRVQITIDCAAPDALADFWAAALGYEKPGPPPGYASWDEFVERNNLEPDIASACQDPEGIGPRLYFQRVPEPKQGKNRMHLDLNVRDMDAEVERLTGLGARVIERCDHTLGEFHETWTIMADPERNEFCVQPTVRD